MKRAGAQFTRPIILNVLRLATVCALLWGTAPAVAQVTGQPATARPPSTVKATSAIDRRLDTASTMSSRAPQSMMLAVATAGSRLVAVGERGMVVYSDNCGALWKQAEVPVSVTLTALQFVDDKLGWAIGHGGVVLVTHDGGATWKKQLDGREIAHLAVASAYDSGDSAEAQRRLRNAERMVSDGPDKPLFALHFWSSQRGIVIGSYGIALITEDGGHRWQWIADRIPNPKDLHLYGLWVHGDRMVLAGEQGFIARSADAAGSFEPVTGNYAGSYFGVVAANQSGSELLLYGLRGNAYRMPLDGRPEQIRNLNVKSSLLSALALNDGSAWLFDADGLAHHLGGPASAIKPSGDAVASPVGQVLGVAHACGGKLALAGPRGVAVVNAATLVVSTRTGAVR